MIIQALDIILSQYAQKKRDGILVILKKKKMQLNRYGQIVKECWQSIPNYYPAVKLDYFVIMPNHLHGILCLNENAQSLLKLSTIIKSFKQVASKNIRLNLSDFAWQKSFYDRIVRDDADLLRIREYVRNNPLKWSLDENNPMM